MGYNFFMKAHVILKRRFERLATILKTCRQNRGLSLEQFEKQYGFSRSAVQRMEAGVLADSQQRWVDILEAIDPTPDEVRLMLIDLDPEVDGLSPDEVKWVHALRRVPLKERKWLFQTLDMLVQRRD
jgi:transcriptional regulator with XRE-family HTH domain